MSTRTPSAGALEVAAPAMSRIRASRVGLVSPNKRPSTPRFLAPSLAAAPSFKPLGRVLPPLTGALGAAGPSKLRESRSLTTATTGEPSRGSKRAAVDCIDLTATTEPDARSSAQKRIRVGTSTARPTAATTTAAHDARAKTKAAAKKDKDKARAEQNDKMTAESITWRMKYKKAFPSFVFYFDALDPATELSLIKSVEYLGATVDNFFSKKVTHVITSRAVPPAATAKENLPSLNSHPPPRNSLDKATDAATGPTRTQKAGRKSPLSYSFLNGQKLPQYTDMLEKNPFIDAQDILSKASEFGLKIWRLDKAQRIISRMNSYSPTKADANASRTLSLPSLLRDEQLFGTRERDPFVPRADTHYFSPKSCYVLVEDTLGEHRPIVVKEYTKPRKTEDPSWPVLWGGIEGRGGFYHYEGEPIVYPSKQRPRPTPRLNVLAVPSLRRTLSLDQFHKNSASTKTLDPAQNLKIAGKADDYIAASGNSQIITSNIASGTSTRSGALSQLGGKGYVDKRLAVLSRKSIALNGKVGGVVQGKLKRTVSVDTGLNERVPPARDEPKKPGYCENCRNKYDDFREHAVSRRHLKFARNPDNWVELDILLNAIARPRVPLVTGFDFESEVYSDDDGEEEDSGFFDASQEEKEEQDDDDLPEDDAEDVEDEDDEEEEEELEEEEEESAD